jgi:hypothetical protein
LFPDADTPPDDRRLPRRATDRVEDVVAWILTAAALVLLVVAGLTGLAVYGRHVESARTMTHARAVLLEEAKVAVGEAGARLPDQVEARWIDRGGVEHRGEILVRESAAVGAEVDVWLRPNGTVTTTRLGREYAVLAGIVSAAGLLFSWGAVLGAAWYGVRCLTAARNARRWEREWARVGPDWSGRRF